MTDFLRGLCVQPLCCTDLQNSVAHLLQTKWQGRQGCAGPRRTNRTIVITQNFWQPETLYDAREAKFCWGGTEITQAANLRMTNERTGHQLFHDTTMRSMKKLCIVVIYDASYASLLRLKAREDGCCAGVAIIPLSYTSELSFIKHLRKKYMNLFYFLLL